MVIVEPLYKIELNSIELVLLAGFLDEARKAGIETGPHIDNVIAQVMLKTAEMLLLARSEKGK